MANRLLVPLDLTDEQELSRFLTRIAELLPTVDLVPSMLTPIVPSATYTQAEAQALATQVAALQTQINSIIESLKV